MPTSESVHYRSDHFQHDFGKIPVRASSEPEQNRNAPRVAHDLVSHVHHVLRTSGRPLEGDVAGLMAHKFGQNFDDVRLHLDSSAAESAAMLGAAAYTVGRHVVFGRERFQPNTKNGLRLLAHELTHVLQQPKNGVIPNKLRVSKSSDESEREAEAVGRQPAGFSRCVLSEVQLQRSVDVDEVAEERFQQPAIPDCTDKSDTCNVCIDRANKWSAVSGEQGGWYIYFDHTGKPKRIVDPELLKRDIQCPVPYDKSKIDPSRFGQTDWPGGKKKKKK